MNKVWHAIATWLYQHGKVNAGMASLRGSYEAPVPQQLQK